MNAATRSESTLETLPPDLVATALAANADLYRVWASDNQVYGPVTGSVLMDWVADGRVFADTWIYVEAQKSWCLAEHVGQLKAALPQGESTAFLERQSLQAGGIDYYELRLFPALAALSNQDLAHFISLAELIVVPAGELIIRRRDPGDAIFFVLSGTARARLIVGGEEKTLTGISAGQFFGEMSMFTHTPRAADVMAEEECRLLRFSAESFHKLITEMPAAAAPMLYNISSTMAQRILDTNNKFQNEVAGGFIWR